MHRSCNEIEEALRINKERTWVFCPVTNVVVKVDIIGKIETKALTWAIEQAVEKNEMLKCRVMLTSEGEAYFEKGSRQMCSVVETDKNWQQVALEEEKKPFNIWKGELIRFFICQKEDKLSLVIVAHHLAGDGLSYAYLTQDIMKKLSGEQIKAKPVKLFTMEDLPDESKLSFPMKLMLQQLNKKWERTGQLFTKEDFFQMADQYWKKHSSVICSHAFEGRSYQQLLDKAKANGITVNTLLTTAFLQAAEGRKHSVGLAVNIREKENESMGNFATGISIDYGYDEKRSFMDNAQTVQKLIHQKLDSPKKKYFLLQFMGSLKGSLIDAIYFSSCMNYANATSRCLSRMFGYEGNPKGISVTNLTRLPIRRDYGSFQLKDFTFLPPRVLNGQRVIGIASMGEKMVITCHLDQSEEVQQHIDFFKRSMSCLKKLIGEE